MKIRRYQWVFLFVFSITACSPKESELAEDIPIVEETHVTIEEEKPITITNQEMELTTLEVEGWEKVTEVVVDQNIYTTFSSRNMKAVVTEVYSEKSFKEIQAELIQGAGDTQLILEANDHVAIRSNRKASIRTDIYYLGQTENRTYVIIFLTPLNEFENNKSIMLEFLSTYKAHLNLPENPQ